jgi:hypothetical protein
MVLSAAGITSGCAEDIPEIFIVANQPFTDECEVPPPNAGANQVFISRGTLDLFLANSYIMAARVESTLGESESAGFTTGGGGNGGIDVPDWEANNIQLRSATIRYDVPDGLNQQLGVLEVPLSGAIEPGGLASVELKVIEDSVAQSLAANPLIRDARIPVTINLRIKFQGQTVTGRDVDSNEFIYPIELCYGCLLTFPPTAIDTEYPVQPNCRGNLDAFNEDEFSALCNIGQDAFVDCRVVCPRVVAEGNDSEGICEPVSGF